MAQTGHFLLVQDTLHQWPQGFVLPGFPPSSLPLTPTNSAIRRAGVSRRVSGETFDVPLLWA